jgi:hypothetical protein
MTPLRSTCPVCRSSDLFAFWQADQVPIHCNVMCATQAEARRAPKGEICLVFCRRCSFIWNSAFEPDRMQYRPGYENSLHASSRFQEYANALAQRLVARHGLHGKEIVEIACGNGEFLRILCRLGNNRGVGFDPGYRGDPEQDEHAASQTTFLREYYTEEHASRPCDLICCRHALEHIDNPVAFLRMIRNGIGNKRRTVVFFEVPNAQFTIRALGIWDLIYEHCSYFTSASLQRCFVRSGFAVRECGKAFGGQFLTIEVVPAAGTAQRVEAATGAPQPVAADVATFGSRYRDRVANWEQKLSIMQRRQQRVVVWGAGSKGVTFLNIVPGASIVRHVVDVNPRKHGKFIAGTGQLIVPPQFLSDYQPHVIIVMNGIYHDEILRTLRDLSVDAKLLIASGGNEQSSERPPA